MQNYYNHFESPQTTEHLKIPMAQCNHLKHCNECSAIMYGNMIAFLMSFCMMIYLMTIVNQVRKFEDKYGIQVYDRQPKWEDLKGPTPQWLKNQN
jgi:hypothetical protein